MRLETHYMLLALYLALMWLAVTAGTAAPGAAGRAEAPVTLAEDQSSFTLANGYVTARIEKQSGTVVSLTYQDLDLLRRGRGYWSSLGGGGAGSRRSSAVRLEPAGNGGTRAEVSCKLSYDGQPASLPADVDLRYALGRGDQGLYVYAIWEHRPGYPAFSVGEARYVVKLNPDIFDFLTVDAQRRRVMPTGYDWDHGTTLNMKEVRRLTTGVHAGEVEHKYDYAAILPETPAYGWSSTKHHVGLWMINPSFEYVAGGPTKVELTGHLDGNPGGLPTLLNMWLGSHYGGSSLAIGEQEAWTKVIGPFLLYCNAGPGHGEMWKDALLRAAREAEAWPYAWVSDPAYPPAAGRGVVTGQIVLRDPVVPDTRFSNLQVGLTAPHYQGRASGGWPANVDWQRDGKYYQFWTHADAQGGFVIGNVRPGTYTLHAFAEGVLGEFSLADIAVAGGKTRQLGQLAWTPVRYGRPLWEIGIPDRSAREFRHGDHYWQWGLYYEYAKEFPNDVNFVIGKSDWRRDWNYCQPPRIEGDDVRSTTWSVSFGVPEAPRGRAVLRLAFCGSRGGCNVSVSVNDKPIGETGALPPTGVMHRDGIRGYWFERNLPFDAALLERGTNTLRLTSHAEDWTQGVLYDYLRLELEPEGP